MFVGKLFAAIALLLALTAASNAQVSGGATVSGSASINAACTPVCATGPLAQSGVNSRYFINTFTGKSVYLTGSHTWDDFDDTSTAASPPAFDFNAFITLLKLNGHNTTILWHKDLPRECSWQNSANYNLTPQPWPRTGPGNASDGLLKFDLSQFNQAFFDRMRARALTAYTNGIYVIVELFDGNNLTSTRCGTNTSPNGDGFPLTSANNINGVTDNYSSGTAGVGAVTEATAGTNPALVAIQDAYVRKMVDTLNDLPNVIWEVAEEQPGTSFSATSGYGGASSMTWWAPHIFELLRTYESGGTCVSCVGSPVYSAKPLQHVAGIGSMNSNDFNDALLYSSTAGWVGPQVSNNFANQFPCIPATANQGKLVLNDTDHTCGASTLVVAGTGAVNDTSIRQSIWGTFTLGASGYVFMDPYHMSLPVNNRNPCASPTNGICTGPMTKYDPMRQAMGYVNVLMPTIVNLLTMTPQPTLCSTAFCLVNNAAASSEFVIYSPAATSFTVNLSGQSSRTINSKWLDPTTGILTNGISVTGGSAAQSFSAPWGNAHDAVLHLTDGGIGGGGGSAGNPQIPSTVASWFSVPNTNIRPLCPSYAEIQGTVQCPSIFLSWNSALFDSKRERLVFPLNGGDQDYFGNETISINTGVNPMTTTLIRDATHNPNLGAVNVEAYLDGNPSARHTYSGPHYIDWLDVYLQYGGFKPNQGGFSNKVWEFDPNAGTWAMQTTSGTPPTDPTSGSEPGTVYDIGDETHDPSIYNFSDNEPALRQFSVYSNTWSGILNTSSGCSGETNLSTVADPVRRIIIMVGQGRACKWLMDSPWTRTVLALTGCTNIIGNSAPGLDYDPIFHDIGMWAGGQTIFFYNPDTDSCPNSIAGAGATVSSPSPQGTFNRLFYDAASGVHAVVNSVDTTLFTIRRDTTAGLQVQDWNNAKGGLGVIASQDFSSSTLFSNLVTTGTGIYAAGGAPSRVPVQDCTTWTSTGCSMKIAIPANLSGPDAGGAYQQWLNTTFSAGQTLYFSFWQKFDAGVLTGTPLAGASTTFFKQVIAATWQGITPDTCDQIEITTVNDGNKGHPRWYSACGAGNGSQVNIGGSDFLQEEGEHSIAADTNDSPIICPGCGGVRDTGFNCHFTGANNGPRSCADYPANTWVNYYYKITLGTLGTATTTVQAWRQLPGQPRQMWSNISNYKVFPNSSNTVTGINLIDLINYYTGRTGCNGCVNGNTWYADLIVSTQPIPPRWAPVN